MVVDAECLAQEFIEKTVCCLTWWTVEQKVNPFHLFQVRDYIFHRALIDTPTMKFIQETLLHRVVAFLQICSLGEKRMSSPRASSSLRTKTWCFSYSRMAIPPTWISSISMRYFLFSHQRASVFRSQVNNNIDYDGFLFSSIEVFRLFLSDHHAFSSRRLLIVRDHFPRNWPLRKSRRNSLFLVPRCVVKMLEVL